MTLSTRNGNWFNYWRTGRPPLRYVNNLSILLYFFLGKTLHTRRCCRDSVVRKYHKLSWTTKVALQLSCFAQTKAREIVTVLFFQINAYPEFSPSDIASSTADFAVPRKISTFNIFQVIYNRIYHL